MNAVMIGVLEPLLVPDERSTSLTYSEQFRNFTV